MDGGWKLILGLGNPSGEAMGEDWKLILGLGNPGERYRSTRHNAGFMALATLAVSRSLGDPSTFKSSLVLKTRLGSNRVILAWPQTYMNLSGQAAREIVNFYKVDPDSILVVHDDMDLETGRLKAVMGGGTAGHNGLESLMGELDGDFARLRIGVGRPDRGLLGGDWSLWVLSPPSAEEVEEFDLAITLAAEAAAVWAVSGLAAAQLKVNKRPSRSPKKAGPAEGEAAPGEGLEPGAARPEKNKK
jgi:PTH1 family peptidyl-tRNA hydrolase